MLNFPSLRENDLSIRGASLKLPPRPTGRTPTNPPQIKVEPLLRLADIQRSLDGTNNNTINPIWGSTGQDQ